MAGARIVIKYNNLDRIAKRLPEAVSDIVLGIFAIFAPRRSVGVLASVMLGTGVGVVLGYVEDGLRR